jgi:[citrate (pro-3S)-lyase] ligase
MDNLEIERIDLNSIDRQELEDFLKEFNLTLDKDVEYSAVVRKNGLIVGTCSFVGKVLKCFAVRSELQGEGIASTLITHVTNILFDRGIFESFIFTKPENRKIFEGLGYKEVHSTNEVVLLEGGMANVNRSVEKMLKKSGLGNEKKAALVMNCNPFTLGHRYLIEKASGDNKEVVVFIVEENKSLVPFEARLELVKRGIKDLNNVTVVAGGDYIISSATFPSYFLRCEDERLKAYTRLDAGIFGKYIVPKFNINKRYIGTEPYCSVTNSYNEALSEVLPEYGVEVIKIERLEKSSRAISASEIRRLIRENEDFDTKIKELVPEVTYDFLLSDEAKPIIDRIKRSDSPH